MEEKIYKKILISLIIFFAICSKSWAEDNKIKVNEKIGYHVGKVMINVAMLSGVVVNCKNDNSTKIFYEQFAKSLMEDGTMIMGIIYAMHEEQMRIIAGDKIAEAMTREAKNNQNMANNYIHESFKGLSINEIPSVCSNFKKQIGNEFNISSNAKLAIKYIKLYYKKYLNNELFIPRNLNLAIEAMEKAENKK